ncbi:MAG: hypothetical protein CMN77_12760, partial [Spirochaetaceae bacterium]|nr:hypothetical protein [Spirochaetaceae bacterium]
AKLMESFPIYPPDDKVEKTSTQSIHFINLAARKEKFPGLCLIANSAISAPESIQPAAESLPAWHRWDLCCSW